jgi:CubicO group peptidase (beta-lactamase class C family)
VTDSVTIANEAPERAPRRPDARPLCLRMGALAVLLAGYGSIGAPAGARTLTAADVAHIAAIENGLVPPVIIKGRPAPAATLASRMAQTKVPGVSIAFFDRGRVVWAKGYGLADVASGRPVTPQTMFQAGSISKPLAAVAALRLVEAGRLDLDQDVNARLKSWQAPENTFTAEQKVTLRRLLSHGAGLTVHGYNGYARGEAVPSTVQILNGQAPANSAPVVVEAVPGSRWAYSGGGYVVTQLLLGETTGQSFPELMREQVLEPAGMAHSTYQQPLPEALHDHAATGYRRNGDPVAGNWHVYPEMAAAGLWTTPSDLARWAIEVQADYAGRSRRLLSPPMARQMLSHQIGPWGLGVQLTDENGSRRFGHGGDDQGFQDDLVAFITGSGQGIVIMTNGDAGNQLIPEIERAVAITYGWKALQPEERTVVAVDPAVLASYAGGYEVPGIAKLTINVSDGRLFAAVPALAQEPFELLAQSPTQFFVLSNGLTLQFVTDANGAATKIAIGGPFGQFEAKRTP